MSALLDNFNRADSTGLGSNWTADPFFASQPAPDVVSNEAKGGSSAYHYAYWNANTYGPDVEVFFTYKSGGAGLFALGICTSGVGTSNAQGYEVDMATNTGSYDMYRYDTAASSPVISGVTGTRVPTIGEIFRLRLYGSLVEFHVSTKGGSTWTLIKSVSDNTYRSSSSRVAFLCSGNGAAKVSVDDLNGGSVMLPLTLASISSTATVSATLQRLRTVVPASVASTSAVTATVVMNKRVIVPGSVASTSTVTATVSGGSATVVRRKGSSFAPAIIYLLTKEGPFA